jgi:pyrimidine-specific ribonucleoside hydrolase
MLDAIWDMETGDPDDFITLLLLLGHPRVNLLGVTITPGTPDQVGVVRQALAWFERSIPVGVFDLDHRTPSREALGDGRHGRRGTCVSSWHYKAYGDIPPSRDAVPGPELLHALCSPSVTLITGGPLKNLGAAIAKPGFRLGRLVVQGGFAGEGVVPRERQLAKFRGLVTCPTYNLNGDPKSALAVLACPSIEAKRFVSKNVCHGVRYDERLHAQIATLKHRTKSLELIWRGMNVHLHGGRARAPSPRRNTEIASADVRLVGPDKRLELVATADAIARASERGLDLVALSDDRVPVCRFAPRATAESGEGGGKKLHDPLVACCAIDESIGEWAEVELYRENGAWGSRLSPGSGVHIITGHDHAKFEATLTEHP